MGRKHLSWPPNGGLVYAIDDIGNVADGMVDNEKIETLVSPLSIEGSLRGQGRQ